MCGTSIDVRAVSRGYREGEGEGGCTTAYRHETEPLVARFRIIVYIYIIFNLQSPWV
jgi:hypothetical protein